MTSSSYVCDTIPPAKLATFIESTIPQSHSPVLNDLDIPVIFEHGSSLEDVFTPSSKTVDIDYDQSTPPPLPQQPPPRKLCVRHQRMADEGTNLRLQQSLDALPEEERQIVNSVWSNFSSSSHPRRALILQGLLTLCCFSQLSQLSEQLNHMNRIDPLAILPREVALKILGYLDAISLCRAAQVTRRWKALADDDVLWRGICEQHIGQKCKKCGWGLPLLEKNRSYRLRSTSPFDPASSPSPQASSSKRVGDDAIGPPSRPAKRQRCTPEHPDLVAPLASESSVTTSVTRPWKDVYSERMTVERNWRRGRCTVRILKGHTDGVMCLQFNENLSHPAFPILITGSCDRTVRVWNLETGAELHCLKGHTRAVRCLQFDEAKLITGSMDNTIKVWDWRRGQCIRTLAGHSDGVVCLNFDSNVLASGSVDSTIRVWNFRSGGSFTLRGHSDWVNAVQLWDSGSEAVSPNESASSPSQIDTGKMLFSASDDGTIKLWDLNLRTCVRQFTGHVGQVQSIKLLHVEECGDGSQEGASNGWQLAGSSDRRLPLLISGSLDNTIKIWDIESGKALRTFFGHIEGVWTVACDKLRLVSGSHDKTIKVWSRDEGRCTTTLVGHQAAVSCIVVGEDKIVSGGDDADIRIWSFGD
ncbi:hypothetical protein M378DRAFT_183963 [Amanita muscaria Koide BX008]|uniref:F-box domain-containing protein n=1 Tax=Amanita muscaria (strain Koide BX008) TaxID=946122 RepID=A0A0C2XKF4_AMAMK|nr:hypothetical protein M378DRAFT_183963 [Amanita muscaria Koide BX008]